MAYWHYCSACKQWSKSATPLSNDKVCPYCNSLLIKKKPYTNSILDKLVTEKLKEPVKSSELTEKEKETNAQNVVE
ncbi:MAG: hypothetical protein GX892_09235, partial [Thermoanaerobacteraceae bacterium]|nr:hypothetical protein [Thermoanaerobacteraceae bacterium]